MVKELFCFAEEQLSLRLTPSQGEKTQNKIRPTSQSQKSAQGKKSRHKRDINYNPIVVWQDHEDIELIPVKDPGKLTCHKEITYTCLWL